MKKIALYSLFAPLIVVVLRLPDIYQQVNLLGVNGIYNCSMSWVKHCSLFEYLFTEDEAIFMYVVMLSSFVGLFLLISYISFLIKLYKDNKRTTLYKVLVLTIFIIVALYCGVYYLSGEY